MLFDKTASTLSTHAARRLSRYRPTTVLLLFLTSALFVAHVSYTIITYMIISPLASLLFSWSSATPAPVIPPSSIFANTRNMGPVVNATALKLARSHLDYPSLPFRRPEVDLMLSYLRPTDIYLEYGASATTLSIPYFVQQAFSIEHNQTVCDSISSQMFAHPALAPRLRAFCAPISPVWAASSHLEEGTYRAFRPYVDIPRNNLSHVTFDRVLINGRARVACALRILPQLRNSSLVFFHDYFLRPEHYSVILPFYYEVARVIATGPVHGYSDDPMGMLVLRPREEYLQRSNDMPESRIDAIYQSFHDEPPTPDTAGSEVAFQHGLMSSGEGGFPYYEMTRKFSKETSQMRIALDLVALPFVVLTYLVLRDLFNKVFVEALSSGSSRGFRLFGEQWPTSNGPTLPVVQAPIELGSKAE